MSQTILSFPPSNGHPCSDAAAEAMAPCAKTLRDQLYRFLRFFPDGLTDQQMQRLFVRRNGEYGMPESTQRPRRLELVAEGRVRDSGETRKTERGRLATVWVAVQ